MIAKNLHNSQTNKISILHRHRKLIFHIHTVDNQNSTNMCEISDRWG